MSPPTHRVVPPSIGASIPKFNTPPGWPTPPDGWLPPVGWNPDPTWPKPPRHWKFVVRDNEIAVPAGPVPDVRGATTVVVPIDAEVVPVEGEDAPLRADIEAAVDRMGRTLGVRRELRRLRDKIDSGKAVLELGRVTRKGHGCLLLVTPRRLLFLREGMIRSQVEEIPVRMLSSVSSKRRLTNGDLLVTVANKREVWRMTSASYCERVSNSMRAAMRDADQPRQAAPAAPPPPVASTPPPVDVVEQLRKLGQLRVAGVVTSEEFEAKKTELLARL